MHKNKAIAIGVEDFKEITQTSQDEFHGTDESVPYEGYAQCRERIYAFRYATWFVD